MGEGGGRTSTKTDTFSSLLQELEQMPMKGLSPRRHHPAEGQIKRRSPQTSPRAQSFWMDRTEPSKAWSPGCVGLRPEARERKEVLVGNTLYKRKNIDFLRLLLVPQIP